MEKKLDLCSHFQLKKCLHGRRRLHEDRITSLPDELLLFIMSSLSFKEMVKTSLLSRRWLNLWMHTPVLDLQAPVTKSYLINDMERRNYIEWVNRVLRRHKCPYLKEFKIVCQLDKWDQKYIESWLVFAFSKKVERLELDLLVSGCYPASLRDNFVFPGWFLDFNSGKELQFDFKCLKSLSLKRVDVTGEAINFCLMNCPFLERLEVVGSLKLVNLVISHPNLALKYLKIESCSELKVLSISNFNLVSLEIPSVNDLTLTNLPFLVELSIEGTSEVLSRSFSQASSCFSQLEAFTLLGFNLKDASLLSNSAPFTKLKRLVVRGGSFICLSLFISHIKSFPKLEEFVFKVERRGSSLKSKSLKVLGNYGRDRDVELIKHVADNAVGLQKIIIDLSGLSTTKEKVALRKLVALRKSIPPHVRLLIR